MADSSDDSVLKSEALCFSSILRLALLTFLSVLHIDAFRMCIFLKRVGIIFESLNKAVSPTGGRFILCFLMSTVDASFSPGSTLMLSLSCQFQRFSFYYTTCSSLIFVKMWADIYSPLHLLFLVYGCGGVPRLSTGVRVGFMISSVLAIAPASFKCYAWSWSCLSFLEALEFCVLRTHVYLWDGGPKKWLLKLSGHCWNLYI